MNFVRNKFRVRGDVVEIFPAYSGDKAIRVEFFGDEIDRISEINTLTGELLSDLSHVAIYPASHYIVPRDRLMAGIQRLEEELKERVAWFQSQGKLLEAQRLEQRTKYDLELLEEIGFCKGIENYSGVLAGRPLGSKPYTLFDHFPDDFLLIVDESHVTIPQVRGMYHGDRARKTTLVEYGFRLPSALDNRPLNFDEFHEKLDKVLYVSATPGEFEREHSAQVVEQVIRPTGLLDPQVIVKPVEGQIDDIVLQINQRTQKGQRVLITTLTKKMAEDLTSYLEQMNIRVRYLHHDVDTIERMELIRDLRLGEFDVLVGINLLREGLDIPEVSLVCILDADKEGFLRSETSLIQTIGRAARNAAGEVILYADSVTPSMENAIRETQRRREIQMKYNQEHGIVPKTIQKDVRDVIEISKKEPSSREAARQKDDPGRNQSRGKAAHRRDEKCRPYAGIRVCGTDPGTKLPKLPANVPAKGRNTPHGYGFNYHQRRQRTQFKECGFDDPPGQVYCLYRAFRFRKIQFGLRYHLRRRPTPVYGERFFLCPAVFGADGKAQCGIH